MGGAWFPGQTELRVPGYESRVARYSEPGTWNLQLPLRYTLK